MIIQIFKKLSELILKFNKETNSNLQIILKGSVLFWLDHQTNDNAPGDLDVILFENSFEKKLAFLNFLESNAKIEIIKNDGNLFIFNFENITIEIILLEYLDEKFATNSQWEGILLLKKKWLFIQKLLALPYIMSDYFPHDRDKKIRRTLEQLSKWKNIVDLDSLYDDESIGFLRSCLWNSFFIFYKYNYKQMLIFDYGNKADYMKITNDQEVIDIIVKFYDAFSADEKIQQIVKIGEKILNHKEAITDFLLNNYQIPSLPGAESKFLSSIFELDHNSDSLNLFYFKKNNENKTIFVSHCDETGGVVIGNNVYNLGTYNWISAKYDLYNLEGKFIKQINANQINDEKYSKEFQTKVARNRVEIDEQNNNDQIFQMVSSQKAEFDDFYFTTRNHDNRINVLGLNFLDKTKLSNINYLITTREEVQLQSSKTSQVKQIIKQNKYIYNLEVSKHPNWDNENLLIRVADFYTGINTKMIARITKIFNDYAIPFKYYFGAGSTDQTEFQFENSLTLAIPANDVHSYSSKIFNKNIFYMLFTIAILNDALS